MYCGIAWLADELLSSGRMIPKLHSTVSWEEYSVSSEAMRAGNFIYPGQPLKETQDN